MRRTQQEGQAPSPAAHDAPPQPTRDLRAHHQRVADVQIANILGHEKPKHASGVGSAQFGAAIRVRGPERFVARVLAELGQIKATSTGAPVLQRLDQLAKAKGLHIDIDSVALAQDKESEPLDEVAAAPAQVGKQAAGSRTSIIKNGAGSSSRIHWNDDESHNSDVQLEKDVARIALLTPSSADPRCAPPFVSLFHELLHALHNMEGRSLVYDLSAQALLMQPEPLIAGRALKDINGAPMAAESLEEELATMGTGAYEGEPFTENALRKELGLHPRKSHFDTCTITPETAARQRALTRR